MFPNPQDALPLPLRPDLEQYKKRAKDLVKACNSSASDALHDWIEKWVKTLVVLSGLEVTSGLPVRIERWVDQVEEFARRKLSDREGDRAPLTDAQFVLARVHGFESWPKFAKHVVALSRTSSSVSKFELAADAIVAGNTAALQRLLGENPELIRARSTREHQATLLHYVSANGVESYRQKTPKNIVQIAGILLKAGAEVDAEADVYGGGATTLGLVATSVHPARAGVQEDLMQALLDSGADMNHSRGAGNSQSLVNGCLANGRGRAAEFLAKRGAKLDIEAAAGVGRLDIVQSFFDEDGNLRAGTTRFQMQRGFLWACGYGRKSVVEFLLERGADLLEQANTGQTALHWAVVGCHPEIVKVLLEHGASVEARNSYGGTALGQALWSVVNGNSDMDYVATLEMLLAAGSQIQDGSLAWLEQQNGSPSVKIRIAEVLRRYGATS